MGFLDNTGLAHAVEKLKEYTDNSQSPSFSEVLIAPTDDLVLTSEHIGKILLNVDQNIISSILLSYSATQDVPVGAEFYFCNICKEPGSSMCLSYTIEDYPSTAASDISIGAPVTMSVKIISPYLNQVTGGASDTSPTSSISQFYDLYDGQSAMLKKVTADSVNGDVWYFAVCGAFPLNALINESMLTTSARFGTVTNKNGTMTLSSTDMGNTICSTSGLTVNLTQTASRRIPLGAEFNFFLKYYGQGVNLVLVFDGVRVVANNMKSSSLTNGLFAVKTNTGNSVKKASLPFYGMASLKKVESSTTNGDLWVLQGEYSDFTNVTPDKTVVDLGG